MTELVDCPLGLAPARLGSLAGGGLWGACEGLYRGARGLGRGQRRSQKEQAWAYCEASSRRSISASVLRFAFTP